MNITIITVAPVPAAYNEAMSAEFQQRYGEVVRSDTRLQVRYHGLHGRQAPLVTPLPVALKHAEMMLDLQRVQGIPIPALAQDGFRLEPEDKQRIQQGFRVQEAI